MFHNAWKVVDDAIKDDRDPVYEIGRLAALRVPIAMGDAMEISRSNVLVSTRVDFGQWLPEGATLAADSPRLEFAGDGTPVTAYFDDMAGGVPGDGKGDLRWLLPELSAGAELQFFLYFHVTGGWVGPKPAPLHPQIVVCDDDRYPLAWQSRGAAQAVADDASSRGATVLNVPDTASFMERVVQEGISDTTVILTQDQIPDALAATMDTNALVRRYVNAGGRFIWMGDTQLHYRGRADGGTDAWGIPARVAILGFDGVTYNSQPIALTSDAANWGIRNTWSSVRSLAPAYLAGPNDVAFAVQDPSGNVSGWLKNFDPAHPYSGFLRIWDTGIFPTAAQREDLWNVASYRIVPRLAFGTVEAL